MTRKRKIVRRVLVFFIALGITALVVGGLSFLFSFFLSGADQSQSLNIAPDYFLEHSPKLEWLGKSQHVGNDLDTANQLAIQAAYLRAWRNRNLSVSSRDSLILEKSYGDTLQQRMFRLIGMQRKQEVFQQVDLTHTLDLQLFSEDRQIIAFTDRGVRMKKMIWKEKSHELLYAAMQEADFEVLMTLDDGWWRIRHMVRKPPTRIPPLPISPCEGDFVYVKEGKFWNSRGPLILKGVNYYPSETPWMDFWEDLDLNIIERDFQLIRDLGLNTIRIFIPFSDFGKGHVKEEKLQQLSLVLQFARLYNLKVIVTLFDFLPTYSLQEYSQTDRQLETILTRFREDDTILAWDIKNEPNLDFKNHGKIQVMDWLEFMVEQARAYDPYHLLTIGWSDTESGPLLAAELDFVSFHFYHPIQQLAPELQALKAAVPNKPLVLEEFGLPTHSSWWLPGGHTEYDQAIHYRKVFEALKAEGDISYLFWTLYDFKVAPRAVFGPKVWIRAPQKRFGVFTREGKPKQVVSEIQRDGMKQVFVKSWKDYIPPFYFTILIILILIYICLRFLYRYAVTKWARLRNKK